MITYAEIRENEAIKTYITEADRVLSSIGYTEHSFAHVCKVAKEAAGVLHALGYGEHICEIAKIAGYMHDIGNLVNRSEHSQSGAVMAFRILDKLGMPPEDISMVVSAIGNHDEGTGIPVNEVAAALILADKSDVRRSRVRNYDKSSFDIHDSVNYSVKSARLDISNESKTITLIMEIDTEYSSVMDFFEIFLSRMLLCKKAAEALGTRFKLKINEHSLL